MHLRGEEEMTKMEEGMSEGKERGSSCESELKRICNIISHLKKNNKRLLNDMTQIFIQFCMIYGALFPARICKLSKLFLFSRFSA